MPYVIKGTINEVFDTFEELRQAFTGSKGNRWMRVADHGEGQAILDGRGVILPAGSYGFTDGNGEGGIGVVLLEMDESGSVHHERGLSSHVVDALKRFPFHDVPGGEEIDGALSRQGSTLAEVAACYLALQEMPRGVTLTLVHDNAAVGNWMNQRSKVRKSGLLRSLVEESLSVIKQKNLQLTFRHQYGHRSDWVGRHDYAHYNNLAHDLADQGSELGE